MGQKINPTGFRVGVYGVHKGWRSRWYAPKREFAKLLKEDQTIRTYLKEKHHAGGIPKIEIERVAVGTNADGSKAYRVAVFVHAARPGLLIGKKGAKLADIQKDLQRLTGQQVDLQIREVRDPELEAQLLAELGAEQLAKRGSFRRTMKNVLKMAKDKGALGCRIRCSGRLGGAEMSRTEAAQFGSIPLQTLRADVDYGYAIAKTTFGVLGIKVWLYRGTLAGVPGITKETKGRPLLPQISK